MRLLHQPQLSGADNDAVSTYCQNGDIHLSLTDTDAVAQSSVMQADSAFSIRVKLQHQSPTQFRKWTLQIHCII